MTKMTNMVQLIRQGATVKTRDIWVRCEEILWVAPHRLDGTEIGLPGHTVMVRELPHEVIDVIEEQVKNES